MRRFLFFPVALALVLGCGGSAGPRPPVAGSQLHFVVEDSTAPALYADSVGFYAYFSQDAQVSLYYRSATGGQGNELLHFQVPMGTLYKRPNGTAFGPGDSIWISIVVRDPHKFDFDFQPTGLQFNPAAPAFLRVDYRHANHDFDGDGLVTASDTAIEARLDLWKNEPPSPDWYEDGAANVEALEEIESSIYSFTHYAVAW